MNSLALFELIHPIFPYTILSINTNTHSQLASQFIIAFRIPLSTKLKFLDGKLVYMYVPYVPINQKIGYHCLAIVCRYIVVYYERKKNHELYQVECCWAESKYWTTMYSNKQCYIYKYIRTKVVGLYGSIPLIDTIRYGQCNGWMLLW